MFLPPNLKSTITIENPCNSSFNAYPSLPSNVTITLNLMIIFSMHFIFTFTVYRQIPKQYIAELFNLSAVDDLQVCQDVDPLSLWKSKYYD